VVVVFCSPHCAVEGGAPFIECQSMEGIVNVRGDVETFKANLPAFNQVGWLERVFSKGLPLVLCVLRYEEACEGCQVTRQYPKHPQP
jgi:hypothetical protein